MHPNSLVHVFKSLHFCSKCYNPIVFNLFFIIIFALEKLIDMIYLSGRGILFRMLSVILYAIVLLACGQKPEVNDVQKTGIESPVITEDISNQRITAIAEDAQGHI